MAPLISFARAAWRVRVCSVPLALRLQAHGLVGIVKVYVVQFDEHRKNADVRDRARAHPHAPPTGKLAQTDAACTPLAALSSCAQKMRIKLDSYINNRGAPIGGQRVSSVSGGGGTRGFHEITRGRTFGFLNEHGEWVGAVDGISAEMLEMDGEINLSMLEAGEGDDMWLEEVFAAQGTPSTFYGSVHGSGSPLGGGSGGVDGVSHDGQLLGSGSARGHGSPVDVVSAAAGRARAAGCARAATSNHTSNQAVGGYDELSSPPPHQIRAGRNGWAEAAIAAASEGAAGGIEHVAADGPRGVAGGGSGSGSGGGTSSGGGGAADFFDDDHDDGMEGMGAPMVGGEDVGEGGFGFAEGGAHDLFAIGDDQVHISPHLPSPSLTFSHRHVTCLPSVRSA